MGEALGLQDILVSTIAGGVIVVTGALYALFFALGRLHTNRTMTAGGLLAFALLTVAVYGLINSLALEGVWIVVTTFMLMGYFFLPRAIWHLCVGTHANESPVNRSRAD